MLESCAQRAGLQTVVTSRTFLEKVNLEPPATPIYIEDYPRFFTVFMEVFNAGAGGPAAAGALGRAVLRRRTPAGDARLAGHDYFFRPAPPASPRG